MLVSPCNCSKSIDKLAIKIQRIAEKNEDKKTERLFIYQNGSSLPIRIHLNRPLNFKTLSLYEYSFDGVPVTGSIPDHLFYDLKIEGIPYNMNWIRSDNKTDLALGLSGSFTHEHLDKIALSEHETKDITNLIIDINTFERNPAVFSKVEF